MSIAHLLLDVPAELGTSVNVSKLHRAWRIKRVLETLEFEVHVHDSSIVDNERAGNMEIQLNIKQGARADFADKLDEQLGKAAPGDLILATEAWHERCFRGLLDADGGNYKGFPVVEMWIDHLSSFARYRIFATRFAMYATAGICKRTNFQADWISAAPYFMASTTKDVSIFEAGMTDFTSASVDHMDASMRGTPVIAPDWGAVAEMVEHGLSGYLYRTLTGHNKAREAAVSLPSAPIIEWVNKTYSLGNAASQIEKYFSRLGVGHA